MQVVLKKLLVKASGSKLKCLGVWTLLITCLVKDPSQPVDTCSKLATETLEQGVKYAQS